MKAVLTITLLAVLMVVAACGRSEPEADQPLPTAAPDPAGGMAMAGDPPPPAMPDPTAPATKPEDAAGPPPPTGPDTPLDTTPKPEDGADDPDPAPAAPPTTPAAPPATANPVPDTSLPIGTETLTYTPANAPDWLTIDGSGSVRLVPEQVKGDFIEYTATAIPDAGNQFAYWGGRLLNNAPSMLVGITAGDPGQPFRATFLPQLYTPIGDTTFGAYHADAGQIDRMQFEDLLARGSMVAPAALVERVFNNPAVTKAVFLQRTLNSFVGEEMGGFSFVAGGVAYYGWSIVFPMTPTTLIHEAAHLYDFHFLSEAQRVRLRELFDADVARHMAANGCDPRGNPVEFNDAECGGGYQLTTQAEYFAVMTTALSDLPDGNIGRAEGTSARQDLQQRFPDAYNFLLEVYGGV